MKVYKLKPSKINIASFTFTSLYAITMWILFLSVFNDGKHHVSISALIIFSLIPLINIIVYVIELKGEIIISEERIESKIFFRKMSLNLLDIVSVKKSNYDPSKLYLHTENKRYSLLLSVTDRESMLDELDKRLSHYKIKELLNI